MATCAVRAGRRRGCGRAEPATPSLKRNGSAAWCGCPSICLALRPALVQEVKRRLETDLRQKLESKLSVIEWKLMGKTKVPFPCPSPRPAKTTHCVCPNQRTPPSGGGAAHSKGCCAENRRLTRTYALPLHAFMCNAGAGRASKRCSSSFWSASRTRAASTSASTRATTRRRRGTSSPSTACHTTAPSRARCGKATRYAASSPRACGIPT